MATFALLALSTLFTCLAPVSEAATCYSSVSFSNYPTDHHYSTSDATKDFKKINGPYKRISGGSGGSATVIDAGTMRGFFPKGSHIREIPWRAQRSFQPQPSCRSRNQRSSDENHNWTITLQGRSGAMTVDFPEGGRNSFCPVGCSSVSKDRGFSTRLMWREGGAMVTYAYYPDKPSSIRCGEDWKWSKKLQSGRWYQIRMWLKLNTSGDKNGEFKAWLDGDEVLHRTGIRYRYKDSFQISRTYLTTYAGGSTVSSFAPSKDQYIWFDDFKAWQGASDDGCGGSSPPSGPTSNPPAPARPPSPPSRDHRRGSTGPQGAPTAVGGYRLVYKEAGWDIPGHFKRTQPGKGSLSSTIQDCSAACDRERRCQAFTYHGDICWLKDDIDHRPTYSGKSQHGWRWFYVEKRKPAY